MLRRKRRSAHRNFCGKFRRKSPKPRPGSRPATRRALKKIRRNRRRDPDASELVTYAQATPRRTILNALLHFPPSFPAILACFFALALIAGCGTRHVTANPPAPSQPSTASPETIESTKRSTDVQPVPATPTPSPAP